KKYLPEFEDVRVVTVDGDDHGTVKKDVTVLHLLTHTSGLGTAKPDRMTDADRVDLEATVRYYIGQGLDFEPFTKQAYSGVAAFDALGLIIERVTGVGYADLCRREIFEPLGMTDTTFAPSREQWSRMTVMHNRTIGKSRIGNTYDGCVFERFPESHAPAGAGLASTLGDYVKFGEMLQNEGAGLVSKESFGLYRTALVPDSVMNNDLHNWGFGVRVITSEDYGPLPVGTFGWSGAYGSHFWVDPVNRVTAVYMKNSRFDGGAGNRSAKAFEVAVFDALEG
ncbi:MAG: beta-lactamase family protein, partial [Ruminococcaceae bacterium]|nr:beta-lactamase family protein [Oscillospiraceae bacterium]